MATWSACMRPAEPRAAVDPQAFFWRTMAGELPPPRAFQTLGGRIVRVDPDAGIAEVAFHATEAFANPMGHVQGGFLAAMLDDTLAPALATRGRYIRPHRRPALLRPSPCAAPTASFKSSSSSAGGG